MRAAVRAARTIRETPRVLFARFAFLPRHHKPLNQPLRE
jgi:hypothetical protein